MFSIIKRILRLSGKYRPRVIAGLIFNALKSCCAAFVFFAVLLVMLNIEHLVYIVLLMLAQVLPIHLSSVITFFLLRILTIALALNILFQTTEISELIAALQASHIPQAIVIPVAIILRFLPSLKQDVLYIKQGMKTRGVGLSFWRIVSHPAQTYEGFLVPILMRLLMTATELSASAETRGISYPCEKTHYILVDFRLRDSILLIGMLALFAVIIWTSFQPISF